MAKFSFFVKTKISDPKKEVSIRIRMRDTVKDYSAATEERVQLQYWDKSKHYFNKKSFKGKDRKQARLQKLKSHVMERFESAKMIDKDWLSRVVEEYLHPERVGKGDLTMFEWIEQQIDLSDKAPRTIMKYKSTLKSLREFDPKLDWDDIDMHFYDNYKRFLVRQNYAVNTIGDKIKYLKAFCNAALERHVHQNREHKGSGFKKPTEESQSIYLTKEEIEKIHQLDLSTKPSLEKVRDLFLIACWTGSRFSDLKKVNKQNIKDNRLRYQQEKTEETVVIFLIKEVLEILEKYEGQLPSISNQKFNLYIKEVCKLAGIDDDVSKTITRGGKRETTYYKKWEMVTCHTGRRSFATNHYKSGTPTISIMAMTGHATESSFLKYIKLTNEEHADLVEQHWAELEEN